MEKKKSPKQTLSIRLTDDTYKILEEYCDDTGQSKTTAVERGLQLLFEKRAREREILKSAQP